MAGSLIIVESPAKIKTIKKYLGKDFDVKASVGHVKDLPKTKLGIDIANDFEPTYTSIPAKRKVLKELKDAAKNVDTIYLAPDPDREGEAISWHVAEEIATKKTKLYRILFNDLTKATVLEALKNPGELNRNKYDAQQTRRILDRLVGYQISPLLWEKVKRGLSAGRVQSVAVRIICDREKEISAFIPEEYWTITALLEGITPPPFEARLTHVDGTKVKIASGEEASRIVEELMAANFLVSSVKKRETKQEAPPPFTTSKLQQEASRKLHFPAKKTMRVAQQLYEGVELGPEGSVGLITYMRTDSVRIADEALQNVRQYIQSAYGIDYLPSRPRVFKASAGAQEAHESIRPASLNYNPKTVENFLSKDQFRLYQLIWNRFIACQMKPALFDQTVVEIEAGRCRFRVTGSIMKFHGFTAVYTESTEGNGDDEMGRILPVLKEGERLRLIEPLKSQQNFTQPPPRFSEATLVKELEEKGIGRPSTYAAILSTIQDRDYVSLKQGRFHPTELGTTVNELLVDNFPNILDITFTASMEDKLDKIEEGSMSRLEALKAFYAPFESELTKAKREMRNIKREVTPTEFTCEKCGNPMVIKWGKNGKFLACSNYPVCKNTMNLIQTGEGEIVKAEPAVTETICDTCGRPMVIKESRFGRFLGCSGYPECTNRKSLQMKPVETGVPCPSDGCDGVIMERRTKKGKTFFGCSKYPACTFALWDRPIPETCPLCGSPYIVEKRKRGKEPFKVCPAEGCTYQAVIEDIHA
ncbi:MAG: type I DNA topoisomerase [Deltaproteobacteria bacterium]|nr:type I DNA topoisomerase [Deltaproteobacteria bacterium]